MAHRSDSTMQREVEAPIRKLVEARLGRQLPSAMVRLDGGAPVQVDGVADDESVLVEIFAHQGRLKPGQRRKVASDVLKLLTLGRGRPHTKLYLAFADDEAAAHTQGSGWLARAVATWGVGVIVVPLHERDLDRIRAVQKEQEMRNLDD
jgi:hypothetical protein